MRALVAVASKYGATAEIGETIARRLRERGLAVDLFAPQAVTTVEGYDAVILGSAVYLGRWRLGARDLAGNQAEQLRRRPVWLFSSGPTGAISRGGDEPVDVREIVLLTNARGHRLFGGRLDRGRLNFADHAVVLALRAPDGDFRDWVEIRDWADEIADAVFAEAAQPRPV